MKTFEVDVSALPQAGLRRLMIFVHELSREFAIELPHQIIDLSGYTCDFEELVWPSNASKGDRHAT